MVLLAGKWPFYAIAVLTIFALGSLITPIAFRAWRGRRGCSS